MSTDTAPKGHGKGKRALPKSARLSLIVKQSVFAQIVAAAEISGDHVSGFIAQAAAAAAEKVLAERGVCAGCLRPHVGTAQPKTAAA